MAKKDRSWRAISQTEKAKNRCCSRLKFDTPPTCYRNVWYAPVVNIIWKLRLPRAVVTNLHAELTLFRHVRKLFFSYPDCKLLRETISRIILPFKKTACAQRFPENYSNGIMDDKFFVLRTIFHRQNVRFFSIHVFFSAPAENDYSELLFARVLHSKHFHSKLGKKQEKKSKKLCISSKTNDPDSEINQKTWSVRF